MASPRVKSSSRKVLPMLGAADVDRFLADADAARTLSGLLFAGDRTRWPEAADVAVVFPELVEAFQGKLQGGVIAPEAEAELATCFGVNVYPSLVFCRGGEVVEIIPKIKDWSVYVTRIAALLSGGAKPATVVKSISTLNRNGSAS